MSKVKCGHLTECEEVFTCSVLSKHQSLIKVTTNCEEMPLVCGRSKRIQFSV